MAEDFKLTGQTLEQLEEQAQTDHGRWPLMLRDMRDTVINALTRCGDDDAEKHTKVVIVAIAHLFGGQRLYIPSGKKLVNAIRDQDIFNRLGRVSAQTLAREYNLSEQHVYDIAQRQRVLYLDKNQGKLFD